MLSLDEFSTVQMCLAAGLHPDPLEELQRSPRPLAAIGGEVLLIREGEKRGRICLLFI